MGIASERAKDQDRSLALRVAAAGAGLLAVSLAGCSTQADAGAERRPVAQQSSGKDLAPSVSPSPTVADPNLLGIRDQTYAENINFNPALLIDPEGTLPPQQITKYWNQAYQRVMNLDDAAQQNQEFFMIFDGGPSEPTMNYANWIRNTRQKESSNFGFSHESVLSKIDLEANAKFEAVVSHGPGQYVIREWIAQGIDTPDRFRSGSTDNVRYRASQVERTYTLKPWTDPSGVTHQVWQVGNVNVLQALD